MLQEFKEFINKGNVMAAAVGLVMALYFQSIIDAVLDGVIYPIIAAVFGKPSIGQVGITLREGKGEESDTILSIGMVIDAIIMFLIVAFVLFLIIKAYNNYIVRKKEEEEEAAGPTEAELLTQIRDLLANR